MSLSSSRIVRENGSSPSEEILGYSSTTTQSVGARRVGAGSAEASVDDDAAVAVAVAVAVAAGCRSSSSTSTLLWSSQSSCFK